MTFKNKLVSAVTTFAAILMFTPLLTNAQTAWEEGTHYQVLDKEKSSSKQIREVFSFWCPHCFTFEPVVEQLKKSLPGDVAFHKVHVNFLGGATRDAQDAATMGMIAAKQMKQDGIYNAAMFNAIQRDRKQINGLNDILPIFAAAGGDAEKLKKMASGFSIKGQLNKNNQLTRGVKSVPSFIVNNKYQAQFTRDMTPDSFVELLLWLVEQP